jgi:hypothetical protein
MLGGCSSSLSSLGVMLRVFGQRSLPEWLPTSFDSDMSHDTHQLWVKKLFRCAEDNPKTLHPVIAEFKATIAT